MKHLIHLLIVFFGISFTMHAQQKVKIGVITDFGDDRQTDTFIQWIEDEAKNAAGNSFDVSIDKDQILSANWNQEMAYEHYKKLTKENDIVILLGAVSIDGVVVHNNFPVPTIGLGVFDTKLQSIPYKDGKSGVKNFSYVLSARPFFEDIKTFYDLVHFEHVTVLLDAKTSKVFDNADPVKFAQKTASFNAVFDFISVNDDIESSLAKMDPETDAVYLAIPYEKSEEEVKRIAAIVNEKKLPSYSMSRSHVDAGIMACKSNDNGIKQMIRKLALLCEDAMNENTLAEQSVSLNFKDELFLNMTTVKSINFSPDFETIFTANIIGNWSDNLPKMGLQKAITQAMEANFGLNASQQNIALQEQELSLAKNQFLPKIDVGVNATQIDKTRAEASFGSNAETSITGTGSVEQLIYSESALANIQIQQYLQDAEQHAFKQDAHNLILDVYTAYFNILQAKTGVAVQKENFDNIKQNLEFAKIRQSIGAGSNSDVYRFEAEIANAQQAVIESYVRLQQAQIQLNKITNQPLDYEFDVNDVDMEDNLYEHYSSSNLGKFVQGPKELDRFAAFLVEEAKNNLPALQQLESNIQAVERQHVMNKRVFYTPTVALQGQANNIFSRGGAGSDPVSLTPGVAAEQEDLSWNVTLNLSYPIFSRNERKINRQKTRIQLDQLNYQRNDNYQNVEMNVRIQVSNLVNATTNMEFSKISAEKSQLNFEIVQDSYKKGQVSIVQLLDAQKAAIQTKLAYNNSIYNYLNTFINLENSIGYYSMLLTDTERNNIQQRFLEFSQN